MSTRLRLAFVVAVLALSASAAAGAATTPTRQVAKVEEAGDGSSVLATLRGRTLYSLSVEKHGKFICTGACLSTWHPLSMPKGVRPKGPVPLGTVERPEGKTQVTYQGRPLYTFSGDTSKGDTNGEGIKDVGTWHAAKTAPAPTPQPTQPAPPSPTPTEPPYKPPYEY